MLGLLYLVFSDYFAIQLEPAPLVLEAAFDPHFERAIAVVAVIDPGAFLPLGLGHRVAVAGDVLVGMLALLQLGEGAHVPDTLDVVVRIARLLHVVFVVGAVQPQLDILRRVVVGVTVVDLESEFGLRAAFLRCYPRLVERWCAVLQHGHQQHLAGVVGHDRRLLLAAGVVLQLKRDDIVARVQLERVEQVRLVGRLDPVFVDEVVANVEVAPLVVEVALDPDFQVAVVRAAFTTEHCGEQADGKHQRQQDAGALCVAGIHGFHHRFKPYKLY